MDHDVDTLRKIVVGERGDNGLNGRVARMERDLYRNPHTDEPGLFAEVKNLTNKMEAFEVTLRNVDWIVKTVGLAGVAAAIRVIFF